MLRYRLQVSAVAECALQFTGFGDPERQGGSETDAYEGTVGGEFSIQRREVSVVSDTVAPPMPYFFCKKIR